MIWILKNYFNGTLVKYYKLFILLGLIYFLIVWQLSIHTFFMNPVIGYHISDSVHQAHNEDMKLPEEYLKFNGNIKNPDFHKFPKLKAASGMQFYDYRQYFHYFKHLGLFPFYLKDIPLQKEESKILSLIEVLKENPPTNSGFYAWSNSTLENATSIIDLDGTDASGWTTANDCTISVDTGRLKLLRGSATTTVNPWAERTITLVKGKLYRLKGQAQAGTWSWGRIQIYDNTVDNYVHSGSMTLPGSMGDFDFSADTTYGSIIDSDGDLIFKAKRSGTYQLILVMTDATTAHGANGKNLFFDNVSVYEVTPGPGKANSNTILMEKNHTYRS